MNKLQWWHDGYSICKQSTISYVHRISIDFICIDRTNNISLNTLLLQLLRINYLIIMFIVCSLLEVASSLFISEVVFVLPSPHSAFATATVDL
jgi:hypothetical protein